MPNAAELWKSASPASKISLLVKYISIQMINMIYSVSKGPIDVRHKTKLTVNDWCGQINFHSTAMSKKKIIQHSPLYRLWSYGHLGSRTAVTLLIPSCKKSDSIL